MNPASRRPLRDVLLRMLAARFYRQYAGMFILLFLAGFAVAPGGPFMYHIGLITALVHSHWAKAIVLLIFTGYYFLVGAFVFKAFRRQESEFLLQLLPAAPPQAAYQNLLISQLAMSAPITVYSILILYISAQNGHVAFFIALVILHFALNVASARFYSSYIQDKRTASSTKGAFLELLDFWRKPFFSFSFLHLFMEKGLAVLMTKVVSTGLLFSSFLVASKNGFDLRFPIFIWLLVLVFHASLVYAVYNFPRTYDFLGGLALTRSYRFFSLNLSFLLLLAPETMLLMAMAASKMSYAQALFAVLLGVGTLFLFYSALYLPPVDENSYYNWVFAIFVTLALTNLYGLLAFMAVGTWLCSAALFYRFYYRKE